MEMPAMQHDLRRIWAAASIPILVLAAFLVTVITMLYIIFGG